MQWVLWRMAATAPSAGGDAMPEPRLPCEWQMQWLNDNHMKPSIIWPEVLLCSNLWPPSSPFEMSCMWTCMLAMDGRTTCEVLWYSAIGLAVATVWV